MYGVELYAAVRLAVVDEGLSHHEAGRRFGIDRRTVKKMLSYSAPPGYRRTKPVRRPKLDGVTGIVDAILEADTDPEVPRKLADTEHYRFWPVWSLLHGWGIDDPEVAAVLEPLPRMPAEDRQHIAHHIPEIVGSVDDSFRLLAEICDLPEVSRSLRADTFPRRVDVRHVPARLGARNDPGIAGLVRQVREDADRRRRQVNRAGASFPIGEVNFCRVEIDMLPAFMDDISAWTLLKAHMLTSMLINQQVSRIPQVPQGSCIPLDQPPFLFLVLNTGLNISQVPA